MDYIAYLLIFVSSILGTILTLMCVPCIPCILPNMKYYYYRDMIKKNKDHLKNKYKSNNIYQ